MLLVPTTPLCIHSQSSYLWYQILLPGPSLSVSITPSRPRQPHDGSALPTSTHHGYPRHILTMRKLFIVKLARLSLQAMHFLPPTQ
ncbi:hypothetical protein E2C01_036871 [Portunus trituberculatus]|uniref:Uncharacterized protein n=1 Tax=Portunus trituberculatus TaxID=210409 RepID=A0A5B7F7U8_PORTR|nr:hypothetical protein [Portunus trituberculatus]